MQEPPERAKDRPMSQITAKDMIPPATATKAQEFVQPLLTRIYEMQEQIERFLKMTGTDAWAEQYHAAHQLLNETNEHQSKIIRANLEHIVRHRSDQETEKNIKDALKQIIEMREGYEGWVHRAIMPMCKTVAKYTELLNNISADANKQERENSLLDRGLGGEVGAIVNSWPRYEFDDETGRIKRK
jgi:hypothetical protein